MSFLLYLKDLLRLFKVDILCKISIVSLLLIQNCSYFAFELDAADDVFCYNYAEKKGGSITMDGRINVITLGVWDVDVSRKFYEKLGFVLSSVSHEQFVAFQLHNLVLCLYPAKLLAQDATVNPQGEGFRAVTLAYSVASKNEVAQVLEHAEKCGAKIVKPAQDVFWGGHSGYFADPDGHLWEIAWNPFWNLDQAGMIQLPK